MATAAAKLNSVSDRISFVQKDCRNLTAHEDIPAKADIVLLEVSTPVSHSSLSHSPLTTAFNRLLETLLQSDPILFSPTNVVPVPIDPRLPTLRR